MTDQQTAQTDPAHGPQTRRHAWLRQHRVALLLSATVWCSVAFFFQGGGWNQNAHFATTVVLFERGTFCLDAYRDSTGDLSHAPDCVVSAKPAGTALAMLPGHLVARVLTGGLENHGNRNLARAYLTTLFGPGLALAGFALVLFAFLRRRLSEPDAALLSAAGALATPLWPFSTMTNSTPFVALTAMWAASLLAAPPSGARLAPRGLLLAGLAAGLPAVFEYQNAVILLPMAIAAWLRAGRRTDWLFFAGGVGLTGLLPLAHHTWVYGNPLHVGYASLVMPGMAAGAAQGFFGIDGLSLPRLYDLLLGDTRGYLFLSPFLIAAVPGLISLWRDPTRRAEALATGGAAWLVLLTVASLSYWHSGWGVASRYATVFVALSVPLVAGPWLRHRPWVGAGMAVAFIIALLATSVTATPPPPGRRPAELTVVGWLYDQFAADKVAFRNEVVLVEQGSGHGAPTWHASFNLGQAVGLRGKASVVPYLLLLASSLVCGWRWSGPSTCPPESPGADLRAVIDSPGRSGHDPTSGRENQGALSHASDGRPDPPGSQ